MSVVMDYRDWVKTFLPSWLLGPNATRLWSVVAYTSDVYADAARVAVLSRLPASADVGALQYVGDGRNIERYFVDTDDTYRARVRAAWDLWFAAGTNARIVAAVTAMGYHDVRVYSWHDLSGNLPDPYSHWWSAFVVIVGPPQVYSADASWGVGTWGDTVTDPLGGPDGPGVWGLNATSYEINQLRAGIRKWKDARDLCVRIYFASGDVWEPVAPWADGGNWGDGKSLSIAGFA